MKILIFSTLCLVLAVVVTAEKHRKNDRTRALEAAYKNATTWTWTCSRGKKIKKDTRDSCFTSWMDFKILQATPGWELQTSGNQNADPEGWLMHSWPAADWSRMRFKDYTFNSNANAKTHIVVTMRGAPDGGKNSVAYLIQTKGKTSLDAAVQDGKKDEIYINEYFGGLNKATSNLFRNGRQVSGFPRDYTVVDAGLKHYKYEIILDNRKRELWFFTSTIDGQLIDSFRVSGKDVPTNPMELFIGMFDCKGNEWCPGEFNGGDSYMAVQSVWVQECPY